MKVRKTILLDSQNNEWLVEKKHTPKQEWLFYWEGECKSLGIKFKGNVRKYVIDKIEEYIQEHKLI
jgi:hypothetical protein